MSPSGRLPSSSFLFVLRADGGCATRFVGVGVSIASSACVCCLLPSAFSGGAAALPATRGAEPTLPASPQATTLRPKSGATFGAARDASISPGLKSPLASPSLGSAASALAMTSSVDLRGLTSHATLAPVSVAFSCCSWRRISPRKSSAASDSSVVTRRSFSCELSTSACDAH